MVLRQDIVDDAFFPATGAFDILWPGVLHRVDSSGRPLRWSLNEVVLRALKQNRLIVAWSEHDLDVALEFGGLDPMLRAQFVERYRNGKVTAKKWLKVTRPEVSFQRDASGRAHRLARYFELIGFQVPNHAGPDLVAKNLKRVESGLAKRASFEALNAGQREAWANVLLHNLYDCVGLRAVVRHAADGLEGRGVPARVPA